MLTLLSSPARATVGDLAWLRERGVAEAAVRRARDGRPILGICGGYQMLADEIVDDAESGAGAVAGLGMLPARVEFARTKTLGRPTGTAYGEPVNAYEIHHGTVTVDDDGDAERFLDGCRVGAVWGTAWHGVMENDGFRRAFLSDVARAPGREFTVAPDTRFAGVREARLDALGDLVEQHLDIDALLRVIGYGAPAGLPVVPPAGQAALPDAMP